MAQRFQVVLLAGGYEQFFEGINETFGQQPQSILLTIQQTIGPDSEQTNDCLSNVVYIKLWLQAYIIIDSTHQQCDNVQDVFVVTNQKNRKVEAYLKEVYQGNMKWEAIHIPDDVQETGDVLQRNQIRNKVKQDFILLACDTITDVNLDEVTDFHMMQNAAMTVVLQQDFVEYTKDGPKIKNPSTEDDEHYVYVISPENNNLLAIEDSDEAKEKGLNIKTSVLIRNPKCKIFTNLYDGHIYVCQRAILDLLDQQEIRPPELPEFDENSDEEEQKAEIQQQQSIEKPQRKESTSSEVGKASYAGPEQEVVEILFKDDFVPWIVKNQYHTELVKLYQDLSAGKGLGFHQEQTSIPIKAFVSDKIYLRRANNLNDYFGINMDSLQSGDKAIQIFKPTINNQEVVNNSNNPEFQMMDTGQKPKVQGSIIGENTTIQEKSTILRSVVGKNCQFLESSQISNSIIMRDCQIEEGAIIQNCIIGNKAVIKAQSKLKDCYIGHNCIVEGVYDSETIE